MRLGYRVSLATMLLCVSSWSLASPHEQPLWLKESAKSQSLSDYQTQVSAGNRVVINPQGLAKLQANDEPQFDVIVPLPDGSETTFALTEIQVMAPQLAAKFPEIRSFKGVDITDPANTGRFDLSPQGFSGMFKYQGNWTLLNFEKGEDKHHYLSYFAKDEINQATHINLDRPDYLRLPNEARKSTLTELAAKQAARPNGNSVTTYRLAISAAAEYTRINGGEAGTLAELGRLVNRINQIFLTDLAIQFELVANNDRLIFTDGESDPFVNDASEDLDANQRTIDDLIGSANYDMGHVVNTDPGGLATIQSICVNGFKARGQSGSSRPTDESFYIQLVIHEFGHQLAADHTFNASSTGACTDDQRSRLAAVEPGSGSTLMSYAGLCAKQNLQDDADSYFHSFSIEQIRDNLDSMSCGTSVANGNTIPNISSAPINHSIPANTPFMLTAEVTDADNDSLTFIWDQIDPGNFSGSTSSDDELIVDNGANPLFRSYPPTDSPTRYFPRLADVLNDTISFGEVYPATQRQLNFELLVRDGKGGVNTLNATLDVEPTTEAFSVNRPLAQVRWIGGQNHTVSWNVAGTASAPINCANVDILLDADGDRIFESTLLASTTNDGQEDVVVPNTNTTNARLMVKCSDNVFFAVNPGRFDIVPGEDPVAPLITAQVAQEINEDTSLTIEFSDLVVDDPDSDYPSNFSLTILPGANYTSSGITVTPSNNFFGTLRVNLTVNDGINDSNVFVFNVSVSPLNDAPSAVDDSESIVQGSGLNVFDVLSNDFDVDEDEISLVEVTYLGAAQVSVVDGKINYTAAKSYFGTDTIRYTIQDPSFASDTAMITIEVRPTDTSAPPTPAPEPTSPDDSGGGSLGMIFILLALIKIAIFRQGAVR
ncbi:reprolysin-like metallopeptidase [Aliiglaciecola litoralis]|uniref:Metallo-peptidase family M12B Reprolysin-like n=1 Tax=Aliiglaciecola litoralis TaxID=582857 RepID=A0ABP3WNM6_9ALTE